MLLVIAVLITVQTIKKQVDLRQRAASTSISGLHVQGNNILNSDNTQILLHGVNRSGTEYACAQGWGIFDGPSDQVSVTSIKSWGINAVRVSLNESCWLGINGISTQYSGAIYQNAIKNYVDLLNNNGLIVVLDLHWAAPGAQLALSQLQMPNRDHTPSFWTSVANTFKNNSSVIFDLYNEPYPDSNKDSTAAWTCLRDGGTCPGISYQAAGMQELVNAVRNAGATNIILVPGVGYSGILSNWITYKPTDPLNNLAASLHTYNFSWYTTKSQWDTYVAPIAAQVPLITGEIGEDDCAHGYIDTLMNWLDAHNASYFGWSWYVGSCGGDPSLITNYDGTPTAYGVGFKNHLAAIAPLPTTTSPTLIPTSTPTNNPTIIPPTPTSIPFPTATPRPLPTATLVPTVIPIPSLQPLVGLWTGEYFNNKTLSGTPMLVRDDSLISFDWGYGRPSNQIQKDNFSVRWTKSVYFETGNYTFSTKHDDGMRVYMDGNQVYNNWRDQAGRTRTFNKDITNGIHQIIVTFYENRGNANAYFDWVKN